MWARFKSKIAVQVNAKTYRFQVYGDEAFHGSCKGGTDVPFTGYWIDLGGNITVVWDSGKIILPKTEEFKREINHIITSVRAAKAESEVSEVSASSEEESDDEELDDKTGFKIPGELWAATDREGSPSPINLQEEKKLTAMSADAYYDDMAAAAKKEELAAAAKKAAEAAEAYRSRRPGANQ